MDTGSDELREEIHRLNNQIKYYKEQELENQSYKNLFNNSTDLIYIHDENGIFIEVNQAVVDKYGYPKEEIIGGTPALFGAPDLNNMEEVALKIRSVWEGGAAETLEWWSKRKNGSVFLKELILRKGLFLGREVIVATGRDITERKEFESKLRQNNDDLKKLNEALDAFVYSASHDLKAPLLSIKGLVNLMEMDSATNPGYYLDRIKASIERLTDFVNDLVDYSRNSRTELKIEKVNFNHLMLEVLGNFEFLPINEEVKKEIIIDPIHDFYSDPYRIYTVLNNLVSNALRYSDQCKYECYVKVKISKSDQMVVMRIEDNGIGIAQEHYSRIFEMFYRGTDIQTGSGLGLYIVNETVLKLKGSIHLESKEGLGTVFEVALPDLREGSR